MKYIPFIVLLIISIIATPAMAQDLSSGSVQFKPKKIRFPVIVVDTCRPKKVEAINRSDSPISNPEFKIAGSNAFSIQSGFKKCPDPLAPGEKCRIYVDFCPSLVITYEATLFFSDEKYLIRMTGEGGAGGPGGGR